MKMRKKSVILLSIIMFSLFQMGIAFSASLSYAYPGISADADDIVNFFDVEAVNVTYSIDPISGSGINEQGVRYKLEQQVFTDPVVRVKSGTIAYSVLGMDDSSNVKTFHRANEQFLQNYFALAKITGEYRLNKIGSMIEARNNPSNLLSIVPKLKTIDVSAVSNLLGLLQASNDTADAAGFIAKGSEKYAISDLDGTYNYQLNMSDAGQVVVGGTLSSQYANLASEFIGNTTNTDIIKASELDDKEDRVVLVSGFQDLEEDGFLTTLRANYAVYHSTASDIVTTDRVTILDYAISSANITTCISEGFTEKIRDAIDEADESATVNTYLSIFGFTLQLGSFNKANAQWFSGFQMPNIGQVFTDVKTTVSTAFNSIVDPVKKTVDNVVKTISGAVDSTVQKTLPIIEAAVSTPQNIVKTVVGETKAFVNDVKEVLVTGNNSVMGGITKTVGGILETGGKLTDKCLSSVTSLGKGLIDQLPMILLFGGAGLLIIFIIFLYVKFSSPKKNNFRPY